MLEILVLAIFPNSCMPSRGAISKLMWPLKFVQGASNISEYKCSKEVLFVLFLMQHLYWSALKTRFISTIFERNLKHALFVLL